ncbi:MAG: YabP/YqfC family sporulation protein [Clostridia bacterium]|nr:YabP/YqfC family sporulation protein [Clostridia bacterium]
MGFASRILPPEAISGLPRVVIEGRGSLLVEQHAGILGYTDDSAVLRLKDGFLCVRGKGLLIACYDAQQLVIRAERIDALEFKP